MRYQAPISHMTLLLEHTVGIDRLRATPAFADLTSDVIETVLQSAATFASEVLAPLNQSGDRSGARRTADGVRAPEGFREAYQRFVADGWPALQGSKSHGGQGMPLLLYAATSEMWASANLAFALCPELAGGATEALVKHASAELQSRFLSKVISGEWSATMCLTEPQAGSDLSNLQTRAIADADAYRLYGRKIFITWGEHDMADNTVHLVLARLPDAPPGVGGISLFLVPRFDVSNDGTSQSSNDIRAISIEHKMGIHASPTCVMALGDGPGARGWMVGKPNDGLAAMFTMMNNMRIGVGIQGVALSERAYQIALTYARERVQGRDSGNRAVAIINHADVRRMLLLMKSLTLAARGLAYAAAAMIDISMHASDEIERRDAASSAALLTPIVKAWCSEIAIEVTSLARPDPGRHGLYRGCWSCSVLPGCADHADL